MAEQLIRAAAQTAGKQRRVAEVGEGGLRLSVRDCSLCVCLLLFLCQVYATLWKTRN